MSRRCYTVDLGDGNFVRVRTNGPPPSAEDVAALREVHHSLIQRVRGPANPLQWPWDADGREVEA